MNYQAMLETATHRRSIRKFKTDPVARKDIEKLISVGMLAPSAFNAQMWEMVVIDDKVLRDEISTVLIESIGGAKTARGFVGAPVFLILYGDERARAYGPPAKTADDAWWQFSLNASLGNAFMCMQLAAASLGLGTMWVSAFRNPEVEHKARQLLNIPDHLKAYEMMAIGYPDVKTGRKKLREINDAVHFNRADNYRTGEELDHWFNPKRTLAIAAK